MANTKPFDVICGPAKVYVAPTGTAFPFIDEAEASFTAGGSGWVALGMTEGGVSVKHNQTIVPIRADQVTAPIKAVRSEEDLEIDFSLAELTLENYATAMNRSAAGPTTGAGSKSVPLYRGGSQVETLALLVRGDHLSPYGDKNLQYEVPACYQSGTPTTQFVKSDKSVLACAFMAIADPDRTSDDEAFGRLRAAT